MSKVAPSSKYAEGDKKGDGDGNPNNKYLIDPNCPFMRKWDITAICMLLFVMVVTPFEVAFLTTSLNGLFFINRLIDCYFIVDMGIQCFLMYRDEEKGVTVKEHDLILKRYFKCWFWIDLASILPFDIMGVAMDSDTINQFKGLRIVRLFRLAKLLRILRAGRMFDRWESAIAINYSMLTLCKFLFLTVIVAHWMACAWHMVKNIEDDPVNNWVLKYGVGDLPVGELYIVALYWSVMTMSTIGYGDVTPATTAERVVATFGMFIGSSIFAYIVGAVTGTVATMGKRKTDFYELMDGVNNYMEEVQLPNTQRMRIREYFRHRFNTGTLHSNTDLLDKMSPALREGVATHTHAGWIRDIPYFTNCNNDFVVKVALCLEHRTFAPHELVITLFEDTDVMYIVKAGVCACKGMIYTSGKVFGEDMITSIIKPSESKRHYTGRALTFSDVYALQKNSLTDLLDKYESTYAEVRRLAIKTVFRECILSYNNAVKNLMTGQRKFSGTRQLVEQFEAKLARLLPTEGDDAEEEAEEEEVVAEDPLGPEGKIITSELQKMTRALISMQDRVVGLEKSGSGGSSAGLAQRIAALEQHLAVFGSAPAASPTPPAAAPFEALATADGEQSRDPAADALPAAASFSSPKK